ncbi:MoxR family ATPase [Paenibacillus sp. alder61]|uniref:MoxR family ATPase n=1 Tax=Paenibacillus faecis TaxID=862114 RepID=A0A5D0D059_9BACL|nr:MULTISPECIES: MoxR family ATPase [Paenibacillus]MCA1294410.1 MoxR family ATPase [Paenibacillus sp. alder61]TYA15596.1 MoxR family ATPase [Paenibacillus faecis]
MLEPMPQVKAWSDTISAVREQISRVIVGQTDVVEQMLWCIFAGGHALLEGIPGLGKTVLVRTIADTLELSFSRIQFTPDLMPSDITGTNVIRFGPQGAADAVFQPGPVFSGIVLADEINRASPKTQSALLEAMQEQTVTVGGETRKLPHPFFVLATQNPLEQEGTYPLPEAQLDRFMLKIHVGYPSPEELKEIVRRTTSGPTPVPDRRTQVADLLEIRQASREVLLADEVLDYGIRLLMMTHPEEQAAPEAVRSYVRFGSGPRGIQSIIAAAKVRAISKGRLHVSTGDIAAVAVPALRHRLFLNFEGQAMGISTDAIIKEILAVLEGAR